MTRRLLVIVLTLACAVMVGCSTLPPKGAASARDRDAAPAASTQPASEADASSADLPSDTLPPYEPVPALTGKIISTGASASTYLVARAAAEFKRIYPSVILLPTAGLASIGPPALLEGRADIVPMSRPLTADEVRDFERKHGYPPTEIKVAADALAIYVEKSNPLPGLTLQQLDAIFSRTQRHGGTPIDTWGQAGLTGDWANRPIILYGYGPEDGVDQVFRREVLEGGAYRLSLRVEPVGSSIVQAIAANPSAIGCASTFFASKRVRAVPLAAGDGRFYAPTEENVRNHTYPLTRFHFIYVNKPPGQPLDGPAAEFLRFLLSREGQQIVAAGGNVPLDAATAREGRHALSLGPRLLPTSHPNAIQGSQP